MKRNLASILFFVSLTTTVSRVMAADDEGGSRCPKVVAAGYMSLGGFLGDMEHLNRQLAQRGYTGLKDYAYHLGAGAFKVRRHRLVTSVELKGIMWRPTSDNNSVSEIYGATGLMNVGFNVLPEGRFLLYPYVGGGFGHFMLHMREKELDFDTVLARPVSDVLMRQRTGNLQAGLGFDFLVPSRCCPNKARVVGVRAGYMFDLSRKRDWNTDDINIRNGPEFSSSGVYGQLVIGRSATRPARWCAHKGCLKSMGGQSE